MTNKEMCQVYNLINEAVDCKEAKKEIPESGGIVYALIKDLNKIEPLYQKIAKEEGDLKSAAFKACEALSEKDKEGVISKLRDDLEALANTVVEMELHKLSKENAFILQKYLSRDSTIVLFNHLVTE